MPLLYRRKAGPTETEAQDRKEGLDSTIIHEHGRTRSEHRDTDI